MIHTLIIFLILFLICSIYLVFNYVRWHKISALKSQIEKNGIISIYILGIIFEITFAMIGSFGIEGDGTPLYVIALLGSSILIIISALLSRKGVYFDGENIVKIGIFGKELININQVKRIENGYYTKVISKNKTLSFETKFYDNKFDALIENILMQMNK